MFIKAGKTIAIAVDYQERLMPAIAHKEEVISMSEKLLTGLRILGVDIYFTQQYTRGLGETISSMREAAGTEEYVEKLTFGAYGELVKVIPPASEKPYAIICGVESHVCVLQTALGLKEAGYTPVLITDCIGSRKDKDMAIAIERAKQEGIILATCESILFELLHEAGSDTFKQISKLVK